MEMEEKREAAARLRSLGHFADLKTRNTFLIFEDQTAFYGLSLLLFTLFFFVISMYAIVVSKLLPETGDKVKKKKKKKNKEKKKKKKKRTGISNDDIFEKIMICRHSVCYLFTN